MKMSKDTTIGIAVVTLALSTVTGLLFLVISWGEKDTCKALSELTGKPTKVVSNIGCAIKVNGEWITRRKWESAR